MGGSAWSGARRIRQRRDCSWADRCWSELDRPRPSQPTAARQLGLQLMDWLRHCLSRKSQFIDCTFPWYNGTFIKCVSQLIIRFTTGEAIDLHLDFFCHPKPFPPFPTWCPHAADLNICCAKHWQKTLPCAPLSFLAHSAKQMLVGRTSHSFKWC